MSDYLPPAVLKLTSEFDPKGVEEAKGGLESLRKQTDDTYKKIGDDSARAGKTSGKQFGDELPKAAKPGLDKLEQAVRDAGKKDSNAWIDEFKKAARTNDIESLTVLSKGLEPAFKKAGKDGAATLYRELAKALGGGGLDTGYTFGGQVFEGVGRDLVDTMAKFGKTGGMQAGDLFSEGFLGGLGKMAMAALPAVAPMAVALASELLADMGGIIEGGSGLGLIFAGAMAQIKSNQQVQAAAKGFTSWFGDQFRQDTAVLDKPLIDAFAMLKTDLAGPVKELGGDFAYLAPWVREFAMYLGAAAEQVMPGFDKAVHSSGPVIREMGKDVAILAGGMSKFFDETSRGTKGEVEGLHTLAVVLGGTIGYFGFLIRMGADAYDMLVKFALGVNWVMKNLTPLGALMQHAFGLDLEKYIRDIGGAFDDSGPRIDHFARALTVAGADAQLTADDLQQLSGKISATAVTADNLAAQMSQKLFDSMMNVDQATLSWHQALTSLQETVKQNGLAIDKHTGSINLNTKAGQANESAILQAVSANMQQYQALVASGVSAADATKQYDANTAALEKQMRQAGYTQKEIDGLIGKYAQVPDTVNTTIAIEGLTEAINDLGDLLRYLNGLPSTKYIDIITRTDMTNRINSNMGHSRWGSITTHAATGFLRQADMFTPVAPARYAFAEPATGGEAFIPRRGNPNRSLNILNQAAHWYGAAVVPRTGPAAGSLVGVGAGSFAPAMSPTAGGYVPIIVNLGGTQMAEVHAQLIQPAQRYKQRTGTTGLS